MSNLGIIEPNSLSIIEGGTMRQIPSKCDNRMKDEAPEIPFLFLKTSFDNIMVFRIPSDQMFMSINSSLNNNLLYLELNPVTKLTLIKNRQPGSISKTRAIKNDLGLDNLRGKVKSVTTFTYNGNERSLNINGELEKEEVQYFSEKGDLISSTSILQYYKNKEFKTTYSGDFGDRKLISSSDTLSQKVVGDTLMTYTKRGSTKKFYKGNCVYYSTPIGINSTTCYDENNDRIITTIENPEETYETIGSIDKKDKFGNWLKLSNYKSDRCMWEREKVTVRKIEYYQ